MFCEPVKEFHNDGTMTKQFVIGDPSKSLFLLLKLYPHDRSWPLQPCARNHSRPNFDLVIECD